MAFASILEGGANFSSGVGVHFIFFNNWDCNFWGGNHFNFLYSLEDYPDKTLAAGERDNGNLAASDDYSDKTLAASEGENRNSAALDNYLDKTLAAWKRDNSNSVASSKSD